MDAVWSCSVVSVVKYLNKKNNIIFIKKVIGHVWYGIAEIDTIIYV